MGGRSGLNIFGADDPVVTNGGIAAVLDGYTTALRGRVQKGRRAVDDGMAHLPDGTSARARAAAAVAAGEVARRAADWQAAAARFFAAGRALVEAKDDAARVALALAVQSALMSAKPDEVVARLNDVVDDSTVTRAIADAALELHRGHVAEARAKLKAPGVLKDPWAAQWLELLTAEILLEMGASTGASQSLARARAALTDDHRFSEPALWLEALEAWSQILVMAALPVDAHTPEQTADLERRLRRLEGYSTAFPLYSAWAAQLRGEQALVVGGSGERAFADAIRVLEAIGASGMKGRFLARQVLAVRRAHDIATGDRAIEARKLLLDVGAEGRVAALVARGGSGGGQMPTVTRKSIAVRLEANALTNATGIDAVIEVSRHLSSIRSLDLLLEKILESVARVMKAERGALLAVMPDGALRCEVARGMKKEDVVENGSAISFGVIREAERSGEPVLTDNALADARFRERRSVVATDIRSVICSPIRTATRTLGFVYLDRRVLDLSFTAEHQDLLGAFCTQVAVAWENALSFDEIERLNLGLEQKVKDRTVELRATNERLTTTLDELTNTRLRLAEAQRDVLEQEMKLARQIQESILPPSGLHERAGARFAGACIPTSFCGGDFWASAEDAEGRVMFVIADVTGHGVAAALITAVARSCLDTLQTLTGFRSPADVLHTLNIAIHGAANGSLCATAFCCVVSPGTKTISFSNAGHNFPHVVHAGKVDSLVQTGMRLGESTASTYEVKERAYEAGDRLVLYTDGIVEWASTGGKEYGGRRFSKSIIAHVAEDPATMITSLVADARTFTDGAVCDDDLTLIVADLR